MLAVSRSLWVLTNNKYLIVNEKSVIFDNKITTTYRGEKISCVDELPQLFTKISEIIKKEHNVTPLQMHMLSSDEKTEMGKIIWWHPSSNHGDGMWAQFICDKHIQTPWCFVKNYATPATCAQYGAYNCMRVYRDSSELRLKTFGDHQEKDIDEHLPEIVIPRTEFIPVSYKNEKIEDLTFYPSNVPDAYYVTKEMVYMLRRYVEGKTNHVIYCQGDVIEKLCKLGTQLCEDNKRLKETIDNMNKLIKKLENEVEHLKQR